MNKSNKVECIEFFKGLSIIGIVLYHLISLFMQSIPSILKYAANVGSSGVLIFFFCSGFSLYLSDMRKHQKLYEFFYKKIKKIYIPYIVVVLLSATIPFVYYGSSKIIAVLSHIFQFRAFSLEYFSSFGGHFWYISTIIQFYIIFYFLQIMLKKIGTNKFMILILIINMTYVLSLYICHQDSNPILIRLFPKYILEFGFGMVIGEKYVNNSLKITKFKNMIYFVIGIIGITILGISSSTSIGRLLNDIPSFIGILSIFYWLYKLNIRFINNIFIYFSSISYEWYLTHMIIFTIGFNYFNGNIIIECVCAVSCLMISILVAKLYSMFCKKCFYK